MTFRNVGRVLAMHERLRALYGFDARTGDFLKLAWVLSAAGRLHAHAGRHCRGQRLRRRRSVAVVRDASGVRACLCRRRGRRGSVLANVIRVWAGLGDLVIEKWDPRRCRRSTCCSRHCRPGNRRRRSRACRRRRASSISAAIIATSTVGPTVLPTSGPQEMQVQSPHRQSRVFSGGNAAALAPLLAERLIEPHQIVVDAKTGVSGAGRGGGEATLGYGEVNEDCSPYALLEATPTCPRSRRRSTAWAIRRERGGAGVHAASRADDAGHLRDDLCQGQGHDGTVFRRGAARSSRSRPFVRVSEQPPHTKWATGTNLVFVSYASDPARNLVIAMGRATISARVRRGRRCRTRTSSRPAGDHGDRGRLLWP